MGGGDAEDELPLGTDRGSHQEECNEGGPAANEAAAEGVFQSGDEVAQLDRDGEAVELEQDGTAPDLQLKRQRAGDAAVRDEGMQEKGGSAKQLQGLQGADDRDQAAPGEVDQGGCDKEPGNR